LQKEPGGGRIFQKNQDVSLA